MRPSTTPLSNPVRPWGEKLVGSHCVWPGARSGAGVEMGTRRSGLRGFGPKTCSLHGFGPKTRSSGAASGRDRVDYTLSGRNRVVRISWSRSPHRLQTWPPGHTQTLAANCNIYLRGRKSVILGVWAAPGAPETLPKGGGLRPPPFGRVSGAPGAAQTPKMADLRS